MVRFFGDIIDISKKLAMFGVKDEGISSIFFEAKIQVNKSNVKKVIFISLTVTMIPVITMIPVSTYKDMISILTMKVLVFLLVETSLKPRDSLKQFPEDSQKEPPTNNCDWQISNRTPH